MTDRDLQDCINDAKESIVENLDGGANYLRRHGDDKIVRDLIHECADGAVPISTGDLLDVFRVSSEIWCEPPSDGFDGANGISDAISRVIYNAISHALYAYVNELGGTELVCEADGCYEEDDHAEPDDDEPLCKTHCGGAGVCEKCAKKLIAAKLEEEDEEEPDTHCVCGSTYSEHRIAYLTVEPPPPVPGRVCPNSLSQTFRRTPAEGRITHAECGCPIGKAHICRRTNLGDDAPWMPGVDNLPYVVGLVGAAIIGRFATELAASTYIGTLPGHTDGRYFLDGPVDEEAE